MIEAPPSRPKSKPERFAEADENIREESIRLAVHYSNVLPGDVVQVENLIKLAAADAREPDGTVVLSSGKKLSDLGGKNILSLAIRIAERAEDIVRSRIIRSWAFNIVYESSPRSTADIRMLAEVERILKNQNRISELEQARFKAGPLSSLDDRQFETLKRGTMLYDPALAEAFDDDEEEFKLLQHWNTLHPPLNALNDDPSYNPTNGSTLAATLLRGQKDLNERVPKHFIDSLTNLEHARLAEFLGTSAKAKRTWYGKREAFSPERQALLTRFPAIRHLLARMQQVQTSATRVEKSERRKKRDLADEAIGRNLTRSEIEAILVEAWGAGEEGQRKLADYRRLIGKFHGRTAIVTTREDVAIEREVESILEAARRKRSANRRERPTSRSVTAPSTTEPAQPAIPQPEPPSALPGPETAGESGMSDAELAALRRSFGITE